MVVQNKKK
jgi:hypothetical protein